MQSTYNTQPEARNEFLNELKFLAKAKITGVA
ncbi:hypothetical protein Solca_4163 [Solitalea canadensis DSM 3403]|uniref:Uncharacterized protein n=1 Tax=Solitalea canadensis (strain ATCC 29591 / DSM 3403 / JCM 21819 / LMG 8368 / NBRC 15130 / NCIMB 12057 / USAM 9D) TaxID=929556 RepID=H8KL70_SOLCM|nr:hypothetical protein Solca_4163 [Solitalea canadensis DSM 3403]